MAKGFFKHSKDLLLICNYSSEILEVSNSVYNILGYYPSDLIGKMLLDYTTESEKEMLEKYAEDLVNKQSKEDTYLSKLVDKNNNIIPIEWTFVVDHSDQVFYANGRVVSKRILIDPVNSIYKNSSRAIYEAMSEGLLIQDKNDKILDYNQAALKILGVTEKQLLGTDSYDPNWQAHKPDGTPFKPEDHPSVYTIRTGKSKSNVLMRITKPNKTKTWISINSEPVFYGDSKSKPENVVITITDITKSKNYELLINSINDNVSLRFGKDFLRSLIEILAKKLKIDHILIGKHDSKKSKIKTLFYYNNGFKENFDYKLENTPCNTAINNDACFYNGNVKDEFPDDQILTDWQIESYIGVPLKNRHGEKLGIITALFKDRIEDIKTIFNIISIFSSRAAVELEREEYESKILERKRFVSILFNTIPFPVFVKDKDLRYIDCNKYFEEFFSIDRKSFIGKTVFELYPSYLAEEYDRKDKELLKQNSGLQRYEWFIKLNNGEIRNVVFNKSCFYDSENNLAGIVGVVDDITDQKLYQKKIKESEAFFKGIFNNTKLGIAITNIHGDITRVNPALEEILAYNESDLIGKDFKKFTHPDYIELEQGFYTKLVDENQTIYYEKKYIRGDNKEIWGSLTLSALRDDKEELIGFIASVIDITDKKNSEIVLKINEEKYRNLFESANDGIVIIQKGSIIDCNQIFIDMFEENNKTDMTNKSLLDYSAEVQENNLSSEDILESHYQKVLNGEKLTFTWIAKTQKDTIVNTEVSLFLSQVYGTDSIVGIIRNITERINFLNHLDRKNKELNEIYDLLDKNLIISHSAHDGRVLNVNENYEKISEYSFEEITNQSYRVVNSGFHPQEFWRDLWLTILDGKTWRGEIKNRTKSGKDYWVYTIIYPVFSRDSEKIDYFLEVSQDITLSKRYQEELEEKVDERTNKLQVLNTEKDFLMSMMSHDLKNPLTAIFMQLSLLETYAMRYNDQKMIQKTQTSLKIAKEMDQLIRNILELNEADSRMVVDKRDNIKLENLLLEIKNSFKPLYNHKNQNIDIQVKGTSQNIKTNSAYLKQILENLISNAIKYSPKEKDINVNIIYDENIKIDIIDSGLGIKKEEMSKLFVKFNKLSNKPTDGEGSNGLGLAIVKRLCELMDYKIEVDSKYGEGTTFTVTL
jgi:PAS domain S-box-containing protein